MALAGSYLHDHASAVGCDRCINGRSGIPFSNSSDRGRVYMEEQADPATARRQMARMWRSRVPSSPSIVHEQSQPPWVPSPRRHEVCSLYRQRGVRRRGSSACPGGGGLSGPFWDWRGSTRAHEKRKVRRTIRRFFFGRTDVLSRPPHCHWYAAGRLFRSGHCPREVWNPARETRRIVQQQRRQQRRRYWQTFAGEANYAVSRHC